MLTIINLLEHTDDRVALYSKGINYFEELKYKTGFFLSFYSLFEY